MMSRKILTFVVGAGLSCAWLPMVHAQAKTQAQAVTQPQAVTQYVVLDNVAAITGQPQVGAKAAIPMKADVPSQIDGAGNIVITCDLVGGKCPNVGTGEANVNLPTAPNVALSGPSGVVTATGQNLTWNVGAPNPARTCYGVSATKLSPPTSGPAVTGWVQAWPATGGTYSLSALYNALPADNIEYTYEFKLGCYSTASTVVNGTTVVAYAEGTRQVKLKKAAGGGGGGDYCSEYYPANHPARSQPGFTTNLTKVERQFTQIFYTFDRSSPVTIEQVLDQGYTGRGGMPGPDAGPGEYLSVAFSVPADTPALTGFELGFIEPQGFLGLEAASKWELSISPCPGDFRAKPGYGQDNPSDFYDRAACHQKNSGAIFFTTGTLTAPGSANSCFVKPGATMYINMTAYDLNGYRSSGAAPVWGCNQGVTYCGLKADVKKKTGF